MRGLLPTALTIFVALVACSATDSALVNRLCTQVAAREARCADTPGTPFDMDACEDDVECILRATRSDAVELAYTCLATAPCSGGGNCFVPRDSITLSAIALEYESRCKAKTAECGSGGARCLAGVASDGRLGDQAMCLERPCRLMEECFTHLADKYSLHCRSTRFDAPTEPR